MVPSDNTRNKVNIFQDNVLKNFNSIESIFDLQDFNISFMLTTRFLENCSILEK